MVGPVYYICRSTEIPPSSPFYQLLVSTSQAYFCLNLISFSFSSVSRIQNSHSSHQVPCQDSSPLFFSPRFSTLYSGFPSNISQVACALSNSAASTENPPCSSPQWLGSGHGGSDQYGRDVRGVVVGWSGDADGGSLGGETGFRMERE